MKISLSLYQDFLRRWLEGKFANQRMGQAFHNHFELHKCVQDKVLLDRLYNADNLTSEKMISELIDWGN